MPMSIIAAASAGVREQDRGLDVLVGATHKEHILYMCCACAHSARCVRVTCALRAQRVAHARGGERPTHICVGVIVYMVCMLTAGPCTMVLYPAVLLLLLMMMHC